MVKKLLPSALLLAAFEAVAVGLWLVKGNLFYLFNFSYIGIALAVRCSRWGARTPGASRSCWWGCTCWCT